MIRQFAILLLSGAIMLWANWVQAETLSVRLVLSDTTPPYQQFSAALDKALGTELNKSLTTANVNVIPSQAGGGAKADLVIAVGIKATELAIVDASAPVLCVMIPRMAYEALLERHPQQKAISAIFLDQPWERQLNFIRAALPKHGTVGLLYSPDARIILPRLPKGMSVNAQSVRPDETFFNTLENILSNSDVLLVTPDSEIYSSNNVRNILLTSYRHKVPLIGISQAYVNAGALCAIFSTAEQIAGQIAKTILSFEKNRQLPAPQYSESFGIAVNQQVARSLGIVLDTPEAIRERMNHQAREGGR